MFFRFWLSKRVSSPLFCRGPSVLYCLFFLPREEVDEGDEEEEEEEEEEGVEVCFFGRDDGFLVEEWPKSGFSPLGRVCGGGISVEKLLLLMFLAVFSLARLFLGLCLIRLFVLFLPADGNSLELLKYMVSVDIL